jgi:hypothetical protein
MNTVLTPPRTITISDIIRCQRTAGRVYERRTQELSWILSTVIDNRRLPPSRDRGGEFYDIRSRAILFSDLPLSAFWLSVEQGGDDGWTEERHRIAELMRPDIRRAPPNMRSGVDNSGAIRSLLPLYRDWGRFLLATDIGQQARGIQRVALSEWGEALR